MPPKDSQFSPHGWTPEQIGSVDGKTFVITGASSGIGLAAARTLLGKGARVVMLNRNPEKTAGVIAQITQEFGASANVSFIEMDLASLDSVRQAAGQLQEQETKIDALVCNAAISQTAWRKLTVDGIESQLGVNHMGHFLLCGLLYNLVEASSGRIVVVGSNAYTLGDKKIHFDNLNWDSDYSPWKAYNQSKLAQMMFGYELQRRLAAGGKQALSQVCQPGASKSNLVSGDVSNLNKVLIRFLKPFFQSADRGSWPQLLCAIDPAVKSEMLYGPSRRVNTAGPVLGYRPAEHALDKEVAARLWSVSEEMTGLEWTP